MAFIRLLIGFGGIILIAWSLIKLLRIRKLESQGIAVEAVVVKIKEYKVRTGRQVYDEYTPLLEYTIAEKTYQTEALSTQDDGKYQLGQLIRIRCQPENPEKIMIVGDRRSYFSAALIGIGGVMIVVLIGLLGR